MDYTKLLAEGQLREVVFSKHECEELLGKIQQIESARWFRRLKINSIPTQGTTVADYYFLGDKQQPKEFNVYLRALAPKLEGVVLQEACINRYDVGQYMPEHRDITQHRFNMVIALNEDGDGITILDDFFPDVQGMATIFPYASKPHSVPPVKHQRYIVIYLYE